MGLSRTGPSKPECNSGQFRVFVLQLCSPESMNTNGKFFHTLFLLAQRGLLEIESVFYLTPYRQSLSGAHAQRPRV